MNTLNNPKINQLLKLCPPRAVILSSWLKRHGYSSDLLKIYRASNWFKSIGIGAMIRSGDSVGYTGAVYALQTQANFPIHIGAHSALSLLGKSQYLELSNTPTIKLFAAEGTKLPVWFKNYDWKVKLEFYTTSIIPSELALTEYDINGNFKVKISNPARAIMECINLASNTQDYIECYELMEGLNNLNPKTVQLLLENCSSIKIKRMFLFLAEFQKHEWFNYLHLEKIDLGQGKRSLIKNGAFDSKYQITIPKEWKYHDQSEL